MRMNKTLLVLMLTTAAAAPLAQADDAGSTTIGGLIFTDLTSISTTQDQAGLPSTDKDPNGFGLDVKRGYFMVNHSFDDVWSANLVTDFNFASYKASSTSTVNGGTSGEAVTTTTTVTTPETQLFIKNLYVQAHLNDWATLRVGAASMPWTSYVEGVYGYRFVENTMTDRSAFANTADWGLHALGGDSLVSYGFSLVNGGGYKNSSRSKSMDEEGRIAVTPLDGALVIAGGFYTGKRGLDTEATPAVHTVSREDLLLAWKADGLTLGLEWFDADKWNNVLTPAGTPTTTSSGTSLFGSYNFSDTAYAVFARYDDVKPTRDTDASQEDKYYNFGVSWKYSAALTWALAYKNDKVTDNLKLGNSTDSLKTQEFGAWAQIKF
ncbi:MAG TPA: carbohydrate porin [Gammaproteobacteria bacterium]